MTVMSIGTRRNNAELIRDCAALGTYGEGRFWTLWKPETLIACDLYKGDRRHGDQFVSVELLQRDPTATAPRREKRQRPAGAEMMPGEWWESRTCWPDELTRHGWALHSTHHDASGGYYEMWTRPGKSIREGASASLYYLGSDVLKVFTSNAAPLTAESTWSLWGFHVAYEHGGDFEAAARAVRRTMPQATASAATPSVNTRAVQSDSLPACPCCGSGNTIEKVSV